VHTLSKPDHLLKSYFSICRGLFWPLNVGSQLPYSVFQEGATGLIFAPSLPYFWDTYREAMEKQAESVKAVKGSLLA
jgi:hypothetical protein